MVGWKGFILPVLFTQLYLLSRVAHISELSIPALEILVFTLSCAWDILFSCILYIFLLFILIATSVSKAQTFCISLAIRDITGTKGPSSKMDGSVWEEIAAQY